MRTSGGTSGEVSGAIAGSGTGGLNVSVAIRHLMHAAVLGERRVDWCRSALGATFRNAVYAIDVPRITTYIGRVMAGVLLDATQ